MLNNLFGVDVNEEAVEICTLSLWVKTAQRGKVLTDLDKTIRVGNSVVEDQSIDAKAFDWSTAFSDVFAAGGFDVVVANPPYIRQEWLGPYKPHWEKRFKSYHGVADIFIYFFELGVGLLREGGRLGFITSGSWVRSNSGNPLRKFLSEHAHVESMIDFGEHQPFEGAEMIRPTITAVSKRPPGGRMRLFKWLTKGKPPENLSDVIQLSPSMSTEHLGPETWALESDEVRALRAKMMAHGSSLKRVTGGGIYRGVLTGLNEVFVIDGPTRDSLVMADPNCTEIIKPLIQGQNLRPWCIEDADQFLLFTRRGIDIERYPAVLEYLTAHRQRLEPKPSGGADSEDAKWPGRKAGGYRWYELQDTVDYWQGFEVPKIVWPDISKLPRFSMDSDRRYLGNTAYMIPSGDYFLLGILASWATWFMISKTAQPLRLRGDRWQYRLFTQFMELLPIPEATEDEKATIGALARLCNMLGQQRYDLQEHVRLRLMSSFGQHQRSVALGLNTKAQSWWELSFSELGESLKSSFKLKWNPLSSPRTGDEWEPYLLEKRTEVERMSRELSDAETELNDRVYGLFKLTPDEIRLLQLEVEH